MSTLAEIEAAVEALPVNEKQALLDFLAAKLNGERVTSANRLAGFRAGAASQRMLEVDAAAGTARMPLEMPLDAAQVIALASAICVQADDDAAPISGQIEAPHRFVHSDFSRQADSCLFRRQIRKVQEMEAQVGVRMSFGPCHSFL